ncbi:MAG: hypothetical protein E3J55_02355 [Dehalococcoidia bacterium]|nr:MAG: hypothetical protein E3J55_02355 [Dehalococcoidia bacterium]
MLGTITDVPGIEVGHYTDRRAVTGCTVILCRPGAVAGVDVSGCPCCSRSHSQSNSQGGDLSRCAGG